MDFPSITIRPATPSDAPFIGETVTGALGPEISAELAGGAERIDIVVRLFSELAARDDAQYSYRNTLVATDCEGNALGAIIAYDAADLVEMRKFFIDKANELLGWSVTYEDAENWEAEASPGEFYLDSLYIVPEYRHRGIGSALIRAAVDRFSHLGKPFGLLCEPENINAYRLYESLGFRRDGTNSFCGTPMYHLTLQKTLSDSIIEEMTALRDETQASHLGQFFKTGRGQYGEGDKFLGIKVPVTRSIVKKYKTVIKLSDISCLLGSEWHEIRLAGFLFLAQLYRKSPKDRDAIVRFYLANLDHSNNWDLVDLVAPEILGSWLKDHPEEESLLTNLSKREDSLWHQRVAIVATLSLIRNGRFEPTFELALRYLTHSHDLIHKATGWMLREVGKHGGLNELKDFLDKNTLRMPRTMLRYAIERFPEEERLAILKRR